MKLRFFTYFFLIVVVPVVCHAQVDTTAVDSISVPPGVLSVDTLKILPMDTLKADTTAKEPDNSVDSLQVNRPDTLDSITPADSLQVTKPDTLEPVNPADSLQIDKPDTLEPVTPTDSLQVNKPDTVNPAKPAGSLPVNKPDTLKSAKPVINFKVRQWYYHIPLLSKVAATDSTLRWQVWLDWLDKKNRDPGVITYRLGTLGRANTMQINAQSPQYQKLYWENVPMNDPVTGMANWSYIPFFKIKKVYETNLGTVHRTTFNLKEYYLNKPLTKLQYTQSNYDTRGLQFMASYNFGRKTNAELSYWNRRGGGEYPNSKVTGNQIYSRVTHILDHHQEVKFNFVSTKYSNGMPFGYDISNPFIYNFDHFSTAAVQPSGKGGHSSSIFSLHYYRRPDSTQPTMLQATVFMRNLKRKVTYSVDTVSYKVRDVGAAVTKWVHMGPLKLEGTTSVNYFIHKDKPYDPLAFGSWLLFRATGTVSFTPFSFLSVSGTGAVRSRNDGYSDNRLGLRVDFDFIPYITMNIGYTAGSRMPTPQQLYWQSRQYQGFSKLQKEQISSLHGRGTITLFRGMEIGGGGYLKQVDNGILLGADSTFANNDAYSSLSMDAFFHYNSTRWEFSGSATLQKFGHYLTAATGSLPVNSPKRIWYKASAYVKGYLFHHATYVKAGLAGVFSPQAYIPDHYYPALNFWQPGQNYIPSFNRLDVDISARLRWIMIVLRYENVLDDFAQPGYFETLGYPMPGRRFIFGVRVYFRN